MIYSNGQLPTSWSAKSDSSDWWNLIGKQFSAGVECYSRYRMVRAVIMTLYTHICTNIHMHTRIGIPIFVRRSKIKYLLRLMGLTTFLMFWLLIWSNDNVNNHHTRNLSYQTKHFSLMLNTFSEHKQWNSALMADFIFIFILMYATMSFRQLQSFTTKGQHHHVISNLLWRSGMESCGKYEKSLLWYHFK